MAQVRKAREGIRSSAALRLGLTCRSDALHTWAPNTRFEAVNVKGAGHFSRVPGWKNVTRFYFGKQTHSKRLRGEWACQSKEGVLGGQISNNSLPSPVLPASWTFSAPFIRAKARALELYNSVPLLLRRWGPCGPLERLIPLKSPRLGPLPPPRLDPVTLSPAPER